MPAPAGWPRNRQRPPVPSPPAGHTWNPPPASNRTASTASKPSASPGHLSRAIVARIPASGTRDRPKRAAFRRIEAARSGGNQYATTRAPPRAPVHSAGHVGGSADHPDLRAAVSDAGRQRRTPYGRYLL